MSKGNVRKFHSSLLPFEEALVSRRILITGNTGFTGSWASSWLNLIGAETFGFSLPPETSPALFDLLSPSATATVFGDVVDLPALKKAVEDAQPDLILHLAAQPLVRRSYREPNRTFEINAQGTANVLEAARLTKKVAGVVCITTDKVYKNFEWTWPYRENDRIGGKDPYSGSKAAAEMIIDSYASSFPWDKGAGPAIAIARGGNVVGGGDWSEDRLIPDFVRAVISDEVLTLRYPEATRPWQHVLALVHAYLILLAGLLSETPGQFARAWNFGPLESRQFSVREVLELMSGCWRRPRLEYMSHPAPEAQALSLDSTNARNLLGWTPPWTTERVISETANWYRAYYDQPSLAKTKTMEQITAWRKELR